METTSINSVSCCPIIIPTHPFVFIAANNHMFDLESYRPNFRLFMWFIAEISGYIPPKSCSLEIYTNALCHNMLAANLFYILNK